MKRIIAIITVPLLVAAVTIITVSHTNHEKRPSAKHLVARQKATNQAGKLGDVIAVLKFEMLLRQAHKIEKLDASKKCKIISAQRPITQPANGHNYRIACDRLI